MTEKRQFLRIAIKLCATLVAQSGNSAPYAWVVSEADGGGVVKSSKCKVQSANNAKPDTRERVILSEVESETQRDERGSRFDIQNSAVPLMYEGWREATGCGPFMNESDGGNSAPWGGGPSKTVEGVIGKMGNAVKTFFSSLLIVFATLFAAPAFAALPAGYTELQYIESTGTQYISTGVGPTDDVTTVVEAVAQGTGDRGIVFSFDQDYAGSYVGDKGTKFYCSSIPENVANNSSLEKTNIETTFTGVSGDYYQQATINGQTGSPYNSKRVFGHFDLFKGASWNHEYSYWAGKIYSFKIYKDGTLVLDFIPAKRNSDGAIGMYDTVNNRFYTNQGTGEFIAGPVAGIHIATTTYNTARFSPVVNDLNTTIATIRDVVTNTINQTAAIADLQATKQTRPADDYTDETNTENCPKFRQCLLVEDNNNIPHWYLIKDPVRDLVKSLRDNKINSAGETTTTAYAANGYDGTNGTVDSRYYKGYPAMRKLADGSTDVYTRQFSSTLLNGTNGGQYKTLGDQEWAVTWNGNETGTANSFLPGVIYGTSRCSKVKPSSTAVGTEGWTTIENSDPVNDAENIASYVYCYCKMTGVGVDGDITPVKNSSRAPWVFDYTRGSAAPCAAYCAYDCAYDVRFNASFRQSLMDWAVE